VPDHLFEAGHSEEVRKVEVRSEAAHWVPGSPWRQEQPSLEALPERVRWPEMAQASLAEPQKEELPEVARRGPILPVAEEEARI